MECISNVGPNVDLLLQAGADFATTVTFTNPDGTPVDLAGSAFEALIRKNALDTVVIASFEVTINQPSSEGTAAMTLPAATAATIVTGELLRSQQSLFYWDLKWTQSNGDISTPIGGKVLVNRQVSR